jgi:GntR family transcriptional regulator
VTHPSQPEFLDPSKSRTIFLLLRDAILSGSLAAGERLPSELKLTEEFGVSRVTVRRALAELQRMGLILRRAGSGTVVAERKPVQPINVDFANLFTYITEMGRKTSVRLHEFGYQQAPPDVAMALGLEDGGEVQRAVRVRCIDGEPFSYLVTFVPERVGRSYSARDLDEAPLVSLFERAGVAIASATQTISAALATPLVADALGVAVGDALMSITRTVFDKDGAGVEHLSALYRPDRYRFAMDLARVGGASAAWAPAKGARYG